MLKTLQRSLSSSSLTQSSFHLWCFFMFCSFYYEQGWFTPGQIFVLDEYCGRYGVRGCFRHLKYLQDLLDRSEKNVLIDPTLIHFSYAFCASHVHGNRLVKTSWNKMKSVQTSGNSLSTPFCNQSVTINNNLKSFEIS